MADYKLRCTVIGHEKDVRAVCVALNPEGGFISGSRDVTARIWMPNEYVYYDVDNLLQLSPSKQ